MPKFVDSSPPKEVDRLKRELRKKEQIALEMRFNNLEKELEEIRIMTETPHVCNKKDTFQIIKDSFANGQEEFNTINSKLDRWNKSKFWAAIGALTGIIVIALTAVYTYARNENNWEHTTDRVDKIETSVETVKKNTNGIIVSFKLMEQSNRAMEEKLESISPKIIEDAVRKGIIKAKKKK